MDARRALNLSLAALSLDSAVVLLATQDEVSWGSGIGAAQLLMFPAYLVDGIVRFANARRARRAQRCLMTGGRSGASWVPWFNLGASLIVLGLGVAIVADPAADDWERGFGAGLGSHGAYLVTLSTVHLVKVRRGRSTWMAFEGGALRF